MTDERRTSPEGCAAAPRTSIVVIGYNQERYIAQSIESVLAQTDPNLECIFVSDGSTDRTLEIVSAIAARDPRLKVFEIPNGGPSNARNTGHSKVSPASRYVGFLDGDDLLYPRFVEACITYLENHAEVGVVLPGYDKIDPAGAIIPTPPGARWQPGLLGLPRKLRASEPDTRFVTFYIGSSVTPFWLGRRSVFDQTDGWDNDLWPYEDTEILCQLSMFTKVHAIPERLVGYRQHSSQGTKGGTQRSRHWKDNGLAVLQSKWNRRAIVDPEKARDVDRACRYYNQLHMPLRNLRVARRAMKEFLADPTLHKLRWLLQLMYFFFRDFLYYKLFFWRAVRSWQAAHPRT